MKRNQMIEIKELKGLKIEHIYDNDPGTKRYLTILAAVINDNGDCMMYGVRDDGHLGFLILEGEDDCETTKILSKQVIFSILKSCRELYQTKQQECNRFDMMDIE